MTKDPVIIALDFDSACRAVTVAARDGASYVLIGREATRSPDPAAGLAAIHAGLQGHR